MGAVISVDQATFAAEVIEKSHQKPVLVDFFAPWCGPCQILKPLLEKLAQEYDFVLAKVDIDQSPDLAHTYGVGGVPDVKVAIDGTLTDGFVGMLPEPKLREFLAQLQITSLLDTALESIYADAAIGNVEQAEARLTNLLEQFLTILISDRRFRDDGARKAMLAIFDLLGDDHPLTKDYRKRLVMALY